MLAITTHSLRHVAASWLFRRTGAFSSMQRMLGHASAAMALDVNGDLFEDDVDTVAIALSNRALRTNVGKCVQSGEKTAETDLETNSDRQF
ncbi:site-specific integrase [Cryobacterium serini]|uniref:Site-specific integrase n=1 Tax=Cryobacterium serini TaxID=1259201 RepID=A0A4V6QIZ0_9MICO|nr:site-specific integrase [Cryobacterium serini]